MARFATLYGEKLVGVWTLGGWCIAVVEYVDIECIARCIVGMVSS